MKKERIKWIDIIKGLAIISVIYLHVHTIDNIDKGFDGYLIKWITSFHMSLFFACAGYFFEYNVEVKKYKIKNKAKSLIIPYVVWGIVIGFLLNYIKEILTDKTFNWSLSIIRIITFRESYLATWFLFTLFGVYIVEYIIAYFFKKLNLALRKDVNILLLGIHIFLLVTGYIISKLDFGNYFRFSKILISSFFFELGYFIKLALKYEDKKNLYFIISILLGLLGTIIVLINGRVTFSDNIYQNPVLALIGCISLICSMFYLVKIGYEKINENKINSFLEWFGRNSIIILPTHMIIILFVRMIEKPFKLQSNWLIVFMEFIIVIIVQAIIIKILPKKALKLYGK